MKYNRFLPLLIPLIIFALHEFYYFRPKLLYVVIIGFVVIILFTVRQFIIVSKRKERWYNFAILPSMFIIGLTAFTTMVSSRLIVQFLFVLAAIFFYFYFRSIYYYLINHKLYQHYSLENLSSYGNFLSFYFWASFIYGLQSFLNIQVWELMVGLLIVAALTTYQITWANRINRQDANLWILIICFILIEVAWSASFLSLSFYILGLLSAICYYMLVGLIRFYLLSRLDKRMVKMYLSFGFLSIILVLLTSRWI
ncbi:hypothetical protein K8R32_04680 [bacterium]|nr:hypothetical protein [bacterium]